MRSRVLTVVLLGLAPGLPASAAPAAGPSETVEIYRAKCQSCHMPDGASPLEPLNFADGKWKHGSEPAAVAKVIANGVLGTAMLAYKEQLTPAEIEKLAAYVRSFDKSLKAGRTVGRKKPSGR
ncbi:MAG TPA: cytochrome c [Vicinamibacteria bacterium]|nr:cytochrome c [Vicinamibacteria bacterium]